MVDEVRGLLTRGVAPEALLALGLEYRYVTEFLLGRWPSEAAMEERLRGAIHAYARRQLVWYRREPGIAWLPGGPRCAEMAVEAVAEWRRQEVWRDEVKSQKTGRKRVWRAHVPAAACRTHEWHRPRACAASAAEVSARSF